MSDVLTDHKIEIYSGRRGKGKKCLILAITNKLIVNTLEKFICKALMDSETCFNNGIFQGTGFLKKTLRIILLFSEIQQLAKFHVQDSYK